MCSVAYLVALLVAEPFVRRMDDRMCCVVYIHLFLILLVGHVLQQAPFIIGSSEDILGSVFLFLVLSILLILVALHVLVAVRDPSLGPYLCFRTNSRVSVWVIVQVRRYLRKKERDAVLAKHKAAEQEAQAAAPVVLLRTVSEDQAPAPSRTHGPSASLSIHRL
jgi:hypothetical protein